MRQRPSGVFKERLWRVREDNTIFTSRCQASPGFKPPQYYSVRNWLGLASHVRAIAKRFIGLAEFVRRGSRTGNAAEGLVDASMLPLFASCPTRREQDLSRNNASRMIAGPSPDLPGARPAASPTCVACQPLANNPGYHRALCFSLAALQPHNTVVFVVHAFLEQASLTLPGNV